MIPKIIHQTWKNETLPEPFKVLSDGWKRNHPGWKYILWTDKMNADFIQNNFPDFLSIYKTFPSEIQRVDAVRYFVLYKMGGVFIDLDFECLKNIEPLLKAESVFGREAPEHCIIHKKDEIISNAFMASAPMTSLFKMICDRLLRYRASELKSFDEILESTGPFMLTEICNRLTQRNQIKILDHSLLFPLSKNDSEQYLTEEIHDKEMSDKLSCAYAIHYYWGSWWKTSI